METKSAHHHNGHVYASRFQDYLYDETAHSRFELITKPLHKCNDESPYYTTQHRDVFFSVLVRISICYRQILNTKRSTTCVTVQTGK